MEEERPAAASVGKAWVGKNMQNTIVDNSKDTYVSKILSFLRFLDVSHRPMLHPDFLRDVTRDKDQLISKAYVKFALYTCYPPRPILDHDKFETAPVHSWLSTLKGRKVKGKKKDADGEPEMASSASYNSAAAPFANCSCGTTKQCLKTTSERQLLFSAV